MFDDIPVEDKIDTCKDTYGVQAIKDCHFYAHGFYVNKRSYIFQKTFDVYKLTNNVLPHHNYGRTFQNWAIALNSNVPLRHAKVVMIDPKETYNEIGIEFSHPLADKPFTLLGFRENHLDNQPVLMKEYKDMQYEDPPEVVSKIQKTEREILSATS